MLAFTLAILLDHFQFALIHDANIPGSYAILSFIALDFTSITSYIHDWVLFLLWFCFFILPGVISPLISSSILGTYWSGKFIFQCPVFFSFSYCSWGSQGKNTEVVCIPFSSGPHFVRTLHHDPSILDGHGSGMSNSFIELDKAVVHVIRLVSFLWLWFSVFLPSDWEGLEVYGSFLMGETDWGGNWVLFW